MVPNKPIKITKSFNFSEVVANDDAIIPYVKIRGYASKMFDGGGDYVIDADSENIDTMGIDLKRMSSGNVPLLFGHSQTSAVGKVTSAEYKADGLEIEAKLFKLPNDELTNYTYEAVKAGILNSFSVGIIVKEFDIIEKGGEDYLQLSKSELIETSLVSVPSNNEATFGIIEVKSIGSDTPVLRTILSKKALKENNPDICSELEQCVVSQKEKITQETDSTKLKGDETSDKNLKGNEMVNKEV